MFADTAVIEIRAGKGGDGKSSFRHEKFRAKGGPDGGDGGRGGDVIFEVDHNLNTLSRYRTNRLITAEDGTVGGGNRMHGKSGQDVVVAVPVGTTVMEGDQVLADLVKAGDRAVLAHGGRGGFGNAHFVSSTRQAPRTAEVGEPGEDRTVKLELKLVADVGLVGLPNAGKSTLLSVISNAKPEIADYPFTTLVPNLGVVDHRDFTFLVADIPGLIEGASQGKGLGDEFLRHVERTAVLLHLVDAASEDPAAAYRTIQGELKAYPGDLTSKPQIVVLTKVETIDDKRLAAVKKMWPKLVDGQTLFVISAQAHRGLDQLLDAVVPLVRQAREARQLADEQLPEITTADLPDVWTVEPEGRGFRVSGTKIEGFARRTNFDQADGVERLRDIMRKMGIGRELGRLGVEPGAIIRIGDHELEWL